MDEHILYHKYIKYKIKYLNNKIKNLQMQIGGDGSDMVKLEGVTPDLYVPKDVAIVGSAPSLLEKDHRMIDNHECVIRVNPNGLHDDFYRSKAGSKCDILFFSIARGPGLSNVVHLPEYKNSKIMCMPDMKRGLKLLEGVNKNLIYWMDTKSKYWCFDSVKNCLNKVGVNDDIKNSVCCPQRRSWSTTGLLGIMLLISSGIRPTVYGFTNNISNKPHKTLGNIYYGKQKFNDKTFQDRFNNYPGNHNKDHHDLEGEARIIKKLGDNSIIKFVE